MGFSLSITASSAFHSNSFLMAQPVELWFAKIERDLIARGVFTSAPDLKRELMRYIRHCNKAPKAANWKYFDPALRISSDSVSTVH